MKRSEQKKQDIFQLITTLVIILVISFISSYLFLRFDLTQEKRYTVSQTSITILNSIKDDIFVRIYLEGDDLPPGFKRLKRSVKELLDELKAVSKANIDYEYINPAENTDKKVQQELYKQLVNKGIRPIDLEENNDGKRSTKLVFPGAIINYKGREMAVNFLKNTQGVDAQNNLNNSIQSLEYELINAIKKVTSSKKPEIAFLEGHCELHELEVMDISRTLSEYYDVKRGKIGGQVGILDNFAAVIIAKPTKSFPEKDKYVIDQYIMNGGKVLWLVDGVNVSMDSLEKKESTIAFGETYRLEDQLFKYGIRINPNLVLDLQCAYIGLASSPEEGSKISMYPWYYWPVVLSKSNNVITKYLNVFKTDFVSSLDTVGDRKEVKKKILLTTSKTSKTMQVPIKVSLDIIGRQPSEKAFNQKNIPIAALLEGSFVSLYKNRILPELNINLATFKAESKPTKMIVVSDGDVIRNEISEKGNPYPLGFDRFTKKIYEGNTEFVLNALNYLCDGEDLMSLRLRELKLRLLDKAEVTENKSYWQLINTVIPLFLVVLFGFLFTWLRKRKYIR